MGEAALLTLVQWLSPAFPTGSFAYSHGLEAAVAAGEVRSAGELRDWVADVIGQGAGRIDATLLAESLRDGADHARLAAVARAMAASRERLAETDEQGAAFTRTVNALTGRGDAPAPLPVAVGRAAAPLGLPAGGVIGLYLQSFATALVLAGVRFIPLGQTEGAKVLAGLAPEFTRIASEVREARIGEAAGSAFGADRAAMAHEAMEVRIFRT
ncbi:MAG: urease accessory protein UreF [Paracoccaceae bacterium]